jgi:DNA-binding transcriptional LysR family regulator
MSARAYEPAPPDFKDGFAARAITLDYDAQGFDQLNLRQLEYWLAVVDTASFTKAAERLRVSQPGLSQQIRALEAELGGRLIERLPRGIRLTPAGKAFLPEARAAVLAAERAGNAARSALALRTVELEIATLRSIAVGILPSAIRRLYDSHPETAVGLHEYGHRDELEQDVRSGVADIAVGPRPRALAGPTERLGWEQFVAVIGRRDPLWRTPRASPVALEDLRDRSWILFPPAHGLSELVAAACARAGFTPRVAVQTQQVEAAARLAAAGVGIALVPDDIVPAELQPNIRRLARPVVRELTAYTRSEWSPPARAFLEILRAERWSPKPRNAEVIP